MEVLAGVIIGVLVTITLLNKPITINVNKKIEEVRPVIPMPDLGAEMKKPDEALDKVYGDDMKGFIDEVGVSFGRCVCVHGPGGSIRKLVDAGREPMRAYLARRAEETELGAHKDLGALNLVALANQVAGSMLP